MSRTPLEEFMVVQGSEPVSLAALAQTGDYVSLEDYGRALVLVPFGDGTHATNDQITITLTQSDDNAGTTTATLPCLKTGRIWHKTGANFAAVLALTGWTADTQAVAANTWTDVTSGDLAGMIAVEVRASDLTDGYKYFRADLSATTNAKIASIVYILTDPRYASTVTAMQDPCA